MRIFISENDRHNAFRAAILNIARFHEIADCDYKTNQELHAEIVAVNSPLLTALNAYLGAYNKWFDFYQPKKRIEEENDIDYNLNDKEKKELGILMTARQNNLDNLQRQFDEIKKG